MDNTLLQLTNIGLKIHDKQILQNISLNIKEGEFVILLGSNGSGKSSLLNLIYRQYIATVGEINFQQKSITEYKLSDFYKQVKYLNQSSTDTLFNQLSIFENYRLIKKPKIKHPRKFLQEFSPSARKLNPNLLFISIKAIIQIATLYNARYKLP